MKEKTPINWYWWSGALAGALSSVCYGMNPLGALNLYADGYAPVTVLLYRFGLAAMMLLGFAVFTRTRLAVSRTELFATAVLGVLFAVSSLSFYASLKLMDSGVACTILFAYPIMTAVIMALFFHERLTVSTFLAIALATLGIALISLMPGGAEPGSSGVGKGVSATGVGLTLLSGLAYAVYIVVVNRSRVRLPLSTMNFWVCVFCTLALTAWSVVTSGRASFAVPQTPRAWFYALFLALVPALLSLVLMSVSCKRIGSTPTAILGALDPLTAVLVGVAVFDEPFTAAFAIGIALILGGVFLVVLPRRLEGKIETGGRQ